MTIDRPTFHESWYRVAGLRPRLLSSVRIYRQHFRGQMWYVLENPSSNSFSRLSTNAYAFIGLLDGRRTVADAWRVCNDQYEDRAPTQGEIIQLLGQLYSTNLLYAELAADTENLFNRYKTRVRRQIQGFLASLLFIRIPLLDPDYILECWVVVFGWLFSWIGFVLWLGIIGTGLYFVFGNIRELIYQSSDVLNPNNLVYLYLSILFTKVCHEFGHAFACKSFGRRGGSGGEVHVMGVMFLVFVPLPYVDATSAWALRNRWHRVVVGMSGVMVELVGAAVAAVVWAHTSTGTIHIVAYNVLFVASISTIIFNANPLLRFDGYYVLSDLIEIPNLAQRSKNYIYYLVKRYCWRLKHTMNPAKSFGERVWFVFYGIASTAYRIFISIRILLFLNSRLPEQLSIVVPFFAVSALIAWVFVPVGRFIRYLATAGELARTRGRAVASTLGSLALTVMFLGILQMPDHCRVEGIVEPVGLAIVHAESDGFAVGYLPSGQKVMLGETVLVKAINPALEAEKKALVAELRVVETKQRIAQTQEVAAAQILGEQVEAIQEKMDRVDLQLSNLNLQATSSGTWVSPEIENLEGMYLLRGQQLGFVADLNDLLIRATARQELAALLVEHAFKDLEIRVKGRPEVLLAGEIEQIYPAGQEVLPSQALGYEVGGSMATLAQAQDPRGVRTAEKFFEIRIRPKMASNVRLLSGQRVVARIRMPDKSLAAQWWRSLRQLFQRRFHI